MYVDTFNLFTDNGDTKNQGRSLISSLNRRKESPLH